MYRHRVGNTSSKGHMSRRARPALEALEDRITPTNITYGGGPIIPHVQVTDIVMGSQPMDTTAFMQAMVRDYLPWLGPDYGIGAGTLQSVISVPPLAGNPTDAQLQNYLQQEINAGAVPPPSLNQVYMFFLAPGQVVSGASGEASYHAGVVTVNNFQTEYLIYGVIYGSSAQQMQVSASHELAESVTDPLGTGYQDLSLNGDGEVADIYALTVPPVSLDGYSVAVLSGPQGQLIEGPQGPASPLPPPVSFLSAAISLYIDGIEAVLHGNSPAIQQNIQANLPYAVFAGINIGEYLVLAGEVAAYNALYGNNP